MSNETKISSFPISLESHPIHRETLPIVQAALTPETETALVSISESLQTLAKFVSGQNISEVVESYAIMSSLGQILNGLTANAGRKGLDASTMEQDAVDGAHRILSAFDRLRTTIEARKNGDLNEKLVDAEYGYKKWKEDNKVG